MKKRGGNWAVAGAPAREKKTKPATRDNTATPLRGAAGEAAAVRYLEDNGCRVVARNVRCRYGEIDIVAEDGVCLAFIEVKARRAGAMVSPREAVTLAKQKKIVQTALLYLAEHDTGKQPRFDVVEVTTRRGAPEDVKEIVHLRGAFDAGV